MPAATLGATLKKNFLFRIRILGLPRLAFAPMPGRSASLSRRRTPTRARPAAPDPAPPLRALLVIDHHRLQNAAWAEFHTVRKRLEKATRDLRRHEEVDSPAYEAWLHRTFPLLVTTLRELNAESEAKARKIQQVQAMAYTSGRSAKRLWREHRERERQPTPAPADPDEPQSTPEPEDDVPAAKSRPARSQHARDIYRRLVQHLHPDRGGDWTTGRERLWHEVQQAWDAGDADWLARLEVDWEAAHEILSATSPLSRLNRAIEELEASRRDIERKLAGYRRSPPWRFTLLAGKRDHLHRRTEHNLNAEIDYLRRELRHLNSLIGAWEEDWTRADSRARHTRRRTRY